MKEILINVSRETRMVDLNKSVIGNDGENLQGKLIFTFIDEFVDGQARLEYEVNGNKNYIVLDKENETYTIPVKNVITKKGQIDMQLVVTEGTNEENVPIFKSNMFYLFCNSSINAVTEAPDGYELWIEQANAKLNKVDEVLDIIKTDGDGTKYLSDDGTYKFVKDVPGEATIIDVQVDGVSVVTNGVANINLSGLDNVLRDILEAIQNGGTTSNTIEEIEQLIVSYFENKTVEEVEA
jgi:hypothetical protein